MDNNKYIATPMGFARVNRQPLEKYSLFDSMDEFMSYFQSPDMPYYEGQVVSVRIYDNLYLQYLICYDTGLYATPLFDTKAIEQNIISAYDKKWILIYYHNSNETWSANDLKLSIDNPFKMSQMINAELYKMRSNFNFLLYKNKSVNRWSQSFNPFKAYDVVNDSYYKTEGSISYISFTNTSNAYITDNAKSYVNIGPKTKSTDVVELYMDISR